MENVHLHATPHRPPMLGCVDVDAGIGPALDEELAPKIEVLVLPGGAIPGRKSSAFMHYDVAVFDVESGLRAILHGPPGERRKAGFIGRLRGCDDGSRG